MTPTLSDFQALAKVLSGLPADDLVALISGNGTVDTALDLAERAASLIAVAYPPGALAAEEAKFGLGLLQYLLDASGYGSSPVKGGYPDLAAEENATNFRDR